MSQLDAPHAVDQTTYIRRLLPRHFDILELVLAGHDNLTISKSMGVSKDMLNMLQRSPLFQAELSKRRRESGIDTLNHLDRSAASAKAQSILDQASERAAATLDGLLEADDDSVRLRAASSILDRVFGKSSEQGAKIVVNVTAEHIQLLHQALQESKHENVSANRPGSQCPESSGSELHQASGSSHTPADELPAFSPADERGNVHKADSLGSEHV